MTDSQTTTLPIEPPAEAAETPPSSAATTVIRPTTGWIGIDWGDILRSRELLYFFIWRDVKVRYKQTVLGAAWAVVQPLFAMVLFTIIFGRVARLGPANMPYAVFVYAALLPWTFFANGVGQAAQSFIGQQNLLTKVYFPRLFIPTASVGSGLIDMGISFGLYACVLLFYGVVPSWQVVFLPLLVLLSCVLTLGIGYFLASLTVTYRDFRHIIPFLLQVWLYGSPVVYPLELVPQRWQWLWTLNPMTGIVEAYRSAFLGQPWNWPALTWSVAFSLVMLAFGMFYLRRTERLFVDIA